MAQPLTDAIEALTTYANSVTGASDETLSEAVATLAEGYGQGGSDGWTYKFSEHQLIKMNGAAGTNSTYGVYINAQNLGNRRMFAVGTGTSKLYESYNQSTFTLTNYYPIPVPPTATRLTVTMTPSTQFFGINGLTESDGKYSVALDDGWKQNTRTVTFTAGTLTHIIINCKYNSSGSSYSVEPTELVITFEE